MRRPILVAVLVAALLAAGASPGLARPQWKWDIDRITRGRSVGLSVAAGGRTLYSRDAKTRRAPASNEKALLSMALFDRLGPSARLTTRAVGPRIRGGTLRGNLYVIGRGDPSITGGGRFGRNLPFTPARLGVLARHIRKAGVRRIAGRVIGHTGYFSHDWFAPGWKSSFPANEVALPSALTIEGNVHRGRHISDPERRLAVSLTKRLRANRVRVAHRPRAGKVPARLRSRGIAALSSAPLKDLVRFMNKNSVNFFAEVLGKGLGAARRGPPGTIAKGARGLKAWAAPRGVSLVAHDGSGLSYRNRVSPRGLVRLLGYAQARPWGRVFRLSLPTGGEGTLEDRLRGVPVRAKTGTLRNISALSGYVRLRRTGGLARFSILSRGMTKSRAVRMEDRIVRILNARGR